MQDSKVVIVHLRKPNLRKADEMRSDPFYEFGSFGCTGCHNKNLMNPKKIKELDGVRLAFAQGGPEGFKLIQLTPPVTHKKHKYRCELKWKPNRARFFKYQNAPLLINNEGDTNFPSLKRMLQDPLVYRKTWAGKFSSKFRSSRQRLPDGVALELSGKYLLLVKDAPKEHFASDYTETMHKRPPKKDSDRAKTYQKCLQEADVAKSCRCRCKQKPC
jgi:hypothetical protein